MRELGLKGIKFSPVYSGFDPWSQPAWEIYELADQLNEIARRCASLPPIDKRSEDEILGYDKKGLPR